MVLFLAQHVGADGGYAAAGHAECAVAALPAEVVRVLEHVRHEVR